MSNTPPLIKLAVVLVILVLVILGAAGVFGGYVLWRESGLEGSQWDGFVREYLVKGSLNSVQQRALDVRPDGIAEAEINEAFDEARQAIDEERMDLEALAPKLKEFLEKYKQVKPSNAEMGIFLEDLRGASQ